MAYTVQHAKIGGEQPHWYQLEAYSDFDKALHRARNYALDHGGYICVKDATGQVVYGADPAQLEISIASGLNRYWRRSAS